MPIRLYISNKIIRSILEYSCVIWHSSITEEESRHFERVQKPALKIILRNDYEDYISALNLTNLQTLKDRRKQLSLAFAKKCLESEKSSDLFPRNQKNVNLRQKEKFFVTPARTERLARSTTPYLQRLLKNVFSL